MQDTEKKGLKGILQVFVPIAGVTVAIVSLLFTLAARRKELVCVYLGSENLVSLQAGSLPPEMKVEYEGEAVSSLVKMKFVVRNIGSLAIKAEDIREPIRLVFQKNIRIVGSSVEKTLPSDFRFQAAFNQTDNSITCSFLLLNSGDEAYFSVYTYNSLPQIPVISGRIVDVKRIEKLDDSQKAQPNPFPFANSLGVRRILYWALTVLNGVLALLAVYLGAWAAQVFLAHRAWPKKIEEAKAAAQQAIKNAQGQTLDFNTALAIEAEKRGISNINFSFSFYSDWKDFLGGTLVFSVLFLVFASTAIFMFFSPRGY